MKHPNPHKSAPTYSAHIEMQQFGANRYAENVQSRREIQKAAAIATARK